MRVFVKPGSLHGSLQVPGSKSHTIRAALLGLLAEGRSIIGNPLASGDGLSALSAAKAFGARIEEREGSWVIEGRGSSLIAPEDCINTGNSGTTTCFFSSVAALVDGWTVITGDEQIRRRPIKRLVDALNTLGATAFLTREGQEAPPVVIKGVLKGGKVRLNGSNSQYVSSLLLSSPLAERDTEILVDNPLETPYVQITLDWMQRYGVEVERNEDYTRFYIKGGQHYTPGRFTIPADFSAVAFPLVAATLSNSDLLLTSLDFLDSQGDKRVIDILQSMGAYVEKDEKEGTLRVKGGATLHGGLTIDLGDIPDSLPALAVAATQAHGITTFTNLGHVRQKETDRVAEMANKLNALGCDLEVGEDSLVVKGPTKVKGGTVGSSGDHRIAMAMVALALATEEGLVVEDAECAAVSFPGFFDAFRTCGADIRELDT
ncbi:3-phosphoshikimate 1-carboxyvinyltransferase [uncultured Sphaerochaeta sp.]|uniref:3-phosphoshikimate 1-carboxyvinyltransferase n=1 Tax=uncultured Sphaerochaeta sp. TaxID=886478 RepID=UPI002A0A5AFC|nr:3-phosphoshikimate 1-carboxyvinyltransferase [uncultured Sphaerochaeta sp.]